MEYIYCYTLADITPTNIVQIKDSNSSEYNQMQNYNMLLQTISLRSQPIKPSVVVYKNVDLSNYEFGEKYRGLHTVWLLSFFNEHLHIWKDGDNNLALLENDVNGVAFIGDLQNTQDFNTNIFEAFNNRNIYFKMMP